MKFLRYLLLFLFLQALPLTAAGAQDRGWKFKTNAGAELSYETNVFNLTDDSIDRMEADLPQDQVSGRFEDMDSPDDVILTPGVELTLSRRGLGGGDFRMEPGVEYHFYTQNSEKSYLELDLGIEHEVGKNGALSLDLGYKPDVFKKNYLSDATDLTGSVSSDERVYSPATYDDASAELGYRHRLWERGKGSDSALDSVYGTVTLGIRNRSFNDTFQNRDEDSVMAGAGVGFKFEGVDIALEYSIENVDTPGGDEVLILDEPDFGVDFNSDGDALDSDRRTVQKVDRSHIDHTVGVEARVKLAKDWTAELRYDYRIQDYQSGERFDTAHNGREDRRHRFGAGLERDLTKKLTLGLDLELTSEDAEIAATSVDPEEVKTYDNTLFAISLSYSL